MVSGSVERRSSATRLSEATIFTGACVNTMAGATFTEPVYVDLLTGKVYEIPRECWVNENGTVTFKRLPIYDSPVLIAEKKLAPFQ